MIKILVNILITVPTWYKKLHWINESGATCIDLIKAGPRGNVEFIPYQVFHCAVSLKSFSFKFKHCQSVCGMTIRKRSSSSSFYTFPPVLALLLRSLPHLLSHDPPSLFILFFFHLLSHHQAHIHSFLFLPSFHLTMFFFSSQSQHGTSSYNYSPLKMD